MQSKPTFGELISRSRPKSDRLRVLAALYSLEALPGQECVTTAAVHAFLRMHGHVPSNLTNALRKAAPLVEPRGIGRRLAWRLTDSGVTELGAASGEDSLPRGSCPPIPTRWSALPSRPVVVILTALHDPEYIAVQRAFGNDWTPVSQGSRTLRFDEKEIRTDKGTDLRLVTGVSSYMGLTAAAIAATQAIMEFRPKLILMVGIAAGVRSDSRHVGDILVADPSVDYLSGKVRQLDGGERLDSHCDPIRLPQVVRSVVGECARKREGLDAIADAWPAAKPAHRLSLHVGPVATGDQVVDAPARVQTLRKSWRKLIGLEMETYAVYRAAVEAPSPQPIFLSLKSICDFANKKNDRWQHYAAHTAAGFASHLIRARWEDLSEGS
jgi:nucleoside phosphorylase